MDGCVSKPTQDTNSRSRASATRIACQLCRKRKLKCNGEKPECATCKRSNQTCEYDESQKKRGPKRRSIREIETRLNEIETRIRNENDAEKLRTDIPAEDFLIPTDQRQPSRPELGDDVTFDPRELELYSTIPDFLNPSITSYVPNGGLVTEDGTDTLIGTTVVSPSPNVSLPSQTIVKDLLHSYFTKISPTGPVLHTSQHTVETHFSNDLNPPFCLRFAIYALAAQSSTLHSHMADDYYRQARQLIQQDEMMGYGSSIMTLGHAQAWELISLYEAFRMYYPRAFLSTRRAVALVQMMGLQSIDAVEYTTKQWLGPSDDFLELEQRRRTFWVAYNSDRWSSRGANWPSCIQDNEIHTRLPCSDEAYEAGRYETAPTLAEVMKQGFTGPASPYALHLCIGAYLGQIAKQNECYHPDCDSTDYESGKFWINHRAIDTSISILARSLPSHLRVSVDVREPQVVLGNMCLHAMVIALHQAAILRARRHQFDDRIVRKSQDRRDIAAQQIIDIMRMISFVDIENISPFTSFALYMAGAAILAQMKDFGRNDQRWGDINFLLLSMKFLNHKYASTASFLKVLKQDMENDGFEVSEEDQFGNKIDEIIMGGDWEEFTKITFHGLSSERKKEKEKEKTRTTTTVIQPA